MRDKRWRQENAGITMNSESILYAPIGIIRTPHLTVQGMPIQNVNAKGIEGTIELKAEYKAGLQDLSSFSHLILLYHFHLVNKVNLSPTPFLDGSPHGLFATRAPSRVNPIGLSVVRLISVDDLMVTISDIDILDNTPILDIKPYIPAFDSVTSATIGWYADKMVNLPDTKADDRFIR
jgi:tRNA (adenine37-N6)-methyltransferase